LRSTATTRAAPAAAAPITEDRPTPPSPTTATLWPGLTLAVLATAPTPVITAQPNSAASSSGTDLSMRCTPRRESTACSAKAETPTKCEMGWPLRDRRLAPDSRVPATPAWPAGSHSTGRPSAQGWQLPQPGTKSMTTWSPTSRSVTPSPSAWITPAASWPSTMGVSRGRSPLMMDRSEWHTPAAATLTSTSPGPGGARSTSQISSGRLSA